jgi:hypothetical protein
MEAQDCPNISLTGTGYAHIFVAHFRSISGYFRNIELLSGKGNYRQRKAPSVQLVFGRL